jgi:hypothetical protein
MKKLKIEDETHLLMARLHDDRSDDEATHEITLLPKINALVPLQILPDSLIYNQTSPK